MQRRFTMFRVAKRSFPSHSRYFGANACQLNYMHKAASSESGGGGGTLPLVIMHGLLGSSGNWRSIIPKLCPSADKYALDLRNHGNSPHMDVMTPEAMVSDLLHTMDTIGIETCNLLGHSLGGKVAMKASLRHPDRFQTLIVVDIAPARYSSGESKQWAETSGIVKAVAELDLAAVTDRDAARALMGQAIPEPAVLAFVLQNLVFNQTQKKWNWRVNAAVLHNNVSTLGAFVYDEDVVQNGPFEKDTLFIAGGKSGYLTEAHKEQIAPLFPSYTMETIPNAGHWLHAESPKEFCRIVNGFLNE